MAEAKEWTPEAVADLIKQFGSKTSAAKSIGMKRTTFHDLCERLGVDRYGNILPDDLTPEELLEYTQNIARQKQKLQDINRVERKTWRENVRISNSLEELNLALLSKIDNLNLPKLPKICVGDKANFGVLHISDTHFGEQVDLDNNKYNWEVAGKRLRKYVLESMRIFDAYSVKEVLIALGGDLVNSDRRLDEVLTNADNRASIIVGATQLLQQAILEVSSKYKTSVISCWGNESRRLPEIGYSSVIASDNYDHTIYKILENNFATTPVNFLGEGLEMLVEFKGVNLFLAHGHTYNNDLEKAISQVKAKYSGDNYTIDYFLSGHIHSSRIGYDYSRAGSLTGNNSYNYNALHLNGRASLNTTIFMPNKDRYGFVVDLQNTDKIDGYSVSELLKAYHTKSQQKTNRETTILKVVI